MRVPPTEDTLGYPVINGGAARCLESIREWIERGDSNRWLACINPHSYVESLKQYGFSAALHGADWLITDGVGIVIASRILGGHICNRVTGSDIFQGVMQQLNQDRGFSVFFLGSTEKTLAEIRTQMARDYPNVLLAGTYSPPFKNAFSDTELSEMVNAINRAKPDVLWVGMTAPKQEIWIQQNLGRLQTVKFTAAIGAVFDFYSGRVKRSHPLLQHTGLEWLARLIQQPRRLWKRMFISAPVFMWHIIRAWAKKF